MKPWLVITTAVIWVTTSHDASAHGNNTAAEPVEAPVHSGGSAPGPAPVPAAAGAPHFSGLSHPYNGSTSSYRPMPYRPVVTYQNGNRTLNYPAVGNSIAHHSMQSATHSTTVHSGQTAHNNTVHTGQASQHTGGSQHKSAGSATAKPRQLDSQTSARLRNWKGDLSSTAQAHQNNANNSHHHHDHDWWRHHCVAFIFWDWGWWGWDDGWWYPAWGYDPYSSYEYNEPIYGDVAPEQIIAGVQTQLQQLGYYTYAIDGKMGPLTRSAVNRYQSDHRLPITSGLDPATLGSLGILH